MAIFDQEKAFYSRPTPPEANQSPIQQFADFIDQKIVTD